MAFNGTGTFVRLYSWVTDKLNSVPITASRMDAEMDGMATGLSNCITKDGQTTITANIPMASHKFTGLSVGNARTDSITLGQVQDGQFTYLGTTSGAADAYTATPAPAITAYANTMQYTAKINATNLTTTPYLQISGIGTPASDAVIKKLASDKSETNVVAGDLIANGIYKFQRNSANNAWIVLNPEFNITSSSIESSGINNLGLSATVGSNALTIALKTKTGSDPSTSNPVQIGFRNSSLTTGTYNTRLATAATSVVISSGSTLGSTSAVYSKIYVYAIDNSGTIELAVSRTLFPDNSIQSTTAEGGAGGADSGSIIYSTTARSNVPIRLIATVTSLQATAGTWVTSPEIININPSSNKVVGASYYSTGAVATGSNPVPFDDTIHQNTEGDEFMSLSYIAKDPANKLRVDVVCIYSSNAATQTVTSLFQDSTADALASSFEWCPSIGAIITCTFNHELVVGTTSSTTLKVRTGSNGSTQTFNGTGGARIGGGIIASSITITELQP